MSAEILDDVLRAVELKSAQEAELEALERGAASAEDARRFAEGADAGYKAVLASCERLIFQDPRAFSGEEKGEAIQVNVEWLDKRLHSITRGELLDWAVRFIAQKYGAPQVEDYFAVGVYCGINLAMAECPIPEVRNASRLLER